jgi:hypothetical protein
VCAEFSGLEDLMKHNLMKRILMKHILPVSIPFLLGASLLTAQSNATPTSGRSFGTATVETMTPGSTSTSIVVIRMQPSCPVGMHAKQGSGGGLVAVRNGRPSDGPSLQIHLVLARRHSQQITGASVLVRGLSGKNRMERSNAIEDIVPDRSQMLDLKFTPDNAVEASADLVLPGFTSIQTVELQSITYADGSTWKMEKQNACTVAPDPMMLVAGR